MRTPVSGLHYFQISSIRKLALPIRNEDEGKRPFKDRGHNVGDWGDGETQEQMKRYGDLEIGTIRIRAES